MISFLITYYNQKDYVRKSIDSIIKQEIVDEFEILICDDGSNDGTVEIIKEYAIRYPKYIRYFIMDRNPKKKYHSVDRVSKARKELLKKCNGKYFCFLDGDDYYIDYSFVKSASEIFKNDSEQKISVVAFNHVIIEINGKETSNKNTPHRGINKPDCYIRNSYIHSGACVFRKDYEGYLEKINSSWQYDDNDIVLYALKYGDMYFIDRDIYAYVQYPNSSYNTMNKVEKSMLNCLGFDVDMNLIPEFKKSLYVRYASSLLTTYVYRYNLDLYLNKERISFYKEMAERISPSFSLSIYQGNEELSGKYMHEAFKSSYIIFFLKYFIIRLRKIMTIKGN